MTTASHTATRRGGRNSRLAIAALLVFAACAKSGDPSGAAPPTDAWIGQWSGPEGTFLRIAGRGGVYEVTIQDLDGPRTFAGRAEADGIAIERDGRRERLHATDGPGTGMKWLADKHDCLGLRPNEGWCRD
jgi:hypothetical protein